jgi:DNA-binding MarR family transcriptional regulator
LTDTIEDRMKDFTIDAVAGHLIRRCQQRAVDLFTDEVGDDGPNPRQFAVLISVFQNPGMSQTALVEASGIDRSTLTEVLRRMIDRGMLSRSRTPEDQRANALFLTDEGRAILIGAFAAAERTQTRILEPIPEADRPAAMKMLAALAGYGINSEDSI